MIQIKDIKMVIKALLILEDHYLNPLKIQILPKKFKQ